MSNVIYQVSMFGQNSREKDPHARQISVYYGPYLIRNRAGQVYALGVGQDGTHQYYLSVINWSSGKSIFKDRHLGGAVYNRPLIWDGRCIAFPMATGEVIGLDAEDVICYKEVLGGKPIACVLGGDSQPRLLLQKQPGVLAFCDLDYRLGSGWESLSSRQPSTLPPNFSRAITPEGWDVLPVDRSSVLFKRKLGSSFQWAMLDFLHSTPSLSHLKNAVRSEMVFVSPGDFPWIVFVHDGKLEIWSATYGLFSYSLEVGGDFVTAVMSRQIDEVFLAISNSQTDQHRLYKYRQSYGMQELPLRLPGRIYALTDFPQSGTILALAKSQQSPKVYLLQIDLETMVVDMLSVVDCSKHARVDRLVVDDHCVGYVCDGKLFKVSLLRSGHESMDSSVSSPLASDGRQADPVFKAPTIIRTQPKRERYNLGDTCILDITIETEYQDASCFYLHHVRSGLASRNYDLESSLFDGTQLARRHELQCQLRLRQTGDVLVMLTLTIKLETGQYEHIPIGLSVLVDDPTKQPHVTNIHAGDEAVIINRTQISRDWGG